jgi:hypothetical protein
MIGVYKGEILLYKTEDGQTKLDVRLEKETIWLDAHQMSALFERDRSVIVKHIRNIYKTDELPHHSTCVKNAQVAADGKTRLMDFYNLDMIISVGYRVNSKRGTQFRIWATQVLKDHILKGYSINEKRLKEQNERLLELQQTVSLLGRIIEERQLAGMEAEGLLKVIADYSMALRLIDDYDYNRIAISDTTEPAKFVITYEEARRAINKLAKESDITHCGVSLSLVPRRQRHPLRAGQQQTHRRQCPCGSDSDDCREQVRRKRRHDQSDCESHKQEELT